MPFDDNLFEQAPDFFRERFSGQALSHLDEIVLSWQYGGHPILWEDSFALFQVFLENGPAPIFRLYAPVDGSPARIEVDPSDAVQSGIPSEFITKLWGELAYIGKTTENAHVPITVSLGKFSRGDRKVFLAYALTIARSLASPPE
jgi:hypothetical protein